MIIFLLILIFILCLIILRLLWDSTYHCWRRDLFVVLKPALMLLGCHFVFLDLDRFGEVNARFGYEQANKLVRASVRNFTYAGSPILLFRYFSGDELLVLARSEAGARCAAQRLQAAFERQGLSATIGISQNPHQAARLVQQAKSKFDERPLEGHILIG